jgi:DNA-3-methyladenine glycosylase II
MNALIATEAELAAGLAALIRTDPRLAAVAARTGALPLRRRAAGFQGLAATVVGQQLSTASANAIWARLIQAVDPFEPARFLRTRTPTLQRAGLSAAKIETLRALAASIRDRQLDLDALADQPAEQAREMLTALRGIGPWTADSYLLFCLGHADAWPAGDLALQEAVRLAFGTERRPTARELETMAERWRPWRAVAARLFWSYYRIAKGREPVAAQAADSETVDGGHARRTAPRAPERTSQPARRVPARLRRRRQ